MTDLQHGSAQGWSTFEHPPGQHHWTAFGAKGTETGTSTSREQAVENAKLAMDKLK